MAGVAARQSKQRVDTQSSLKLLTPPVRDLPWLS